ncbi:MAG TPA: HD domain-containing protein [Gammaproteobacteria bacterium]|nr:HD domain-containing protein [Gammaproteobacteria bacterium]
MTTSNRYHVIKDPVHGTMQFTDVEDKWVKPFINSPHFQRLRHIKQLGMGDFIFPGAVHSRFNHCLGCSYVGSQIAHKIGLADEERQLVMIACLLHDIGHGPFSHTFEDVFHQKLIRHEDWTPFFLADYRTSYFFDEYNELNPRYSLTESKFAQVEDMIMHRGTAKRVLADIVSSQLDADRLDYLLRDSHFCGVAYGEFDFRWMLHCMAIVNDQQQERLGITHKGIGVVEHYLMARRLMIRNIYLQQKKLALEFLLIQFLINVSENLEQYPEIEATRLGLFLSRVNGFNAKARDSQDINALKQEFLSECYPIYKELCDYDVFALIDKLAILSDGSPASQIAARLQCRRMPKIIHLDLQRLTQVEPLINEFKLQNQNSIQSWQMALIKTPYQSYVAEGDPILVVNELGAVRPIDEMSLMINAISDKYEQTGFLCIDRAILADDKVSYLLKKVRTNGAI